MLISDFMVVSPSHTFPWDGLTFPNFSVLAFKGLHGLSHLPGLPGESMGKDGNPESGALHLTAGTEDRWTEQVPRGRCKMRPGSEM